MASPRRLFLKPEELPPGHPLEAPCDIRELYEVFGRYPYLVVGPDDFAATDEDGEKMKDWVEVLMAELGGQGTYTFAELIRLAGPFSAEWVDASQAMTFVLKQHGLLPVGVKWAFVVHGKHAGKYALSHYV